MTPDVTPTISSSSANKKTTVFQPTIPTISSAKTRNTPNLRDTGVDERPSVALGMYRFHPQYRHVLTELLDAAVGEIAFQSLLQHEDRITCNDSVLCGPGWNDPGFTQFRSPTGAEISCGDSRSHSRNCSYVIGRDSFYLLLDLLLMLRFPWHLQRLWPFLFAAERVPDRIRSGFGNCLD